MGRYTSGFFPEQQHHSPFTENWENRNGHNGDMATMSIRPQYDHDTAMIEPLFRH